MTEDSRCNSTASRAGGLRVRPQVMQRQRTTESTESQVRMYQSSDNVRDALTSFGGRLALSADEVAEALGISRAHVWKLASTGRLPKPVRLGRAVRWARKDLEEWLAAGAPSRDRWEAENGRRRG